MRLVPVLGFLALGFSSLLQSAASGGAAAAVVRVEAFSPEGTVSEVRQVTARFSAPVVALGDPRLPDPFTVACAAAGKGRWADTRNWVYDFDADLPAGLRCTFTLRAGQSAADGSAVESGRSFSFDTGGPAIAAAMPSEGNEEIDERQVFLVKLDAVATTASIGSRARCEVEGIAESIPVEVLGGAERAAVLAQRAALGYAYYMILWKDGEVSAARVRDPALQGAEESVAALRCARPLPPDTEMQLVWGAGIATTSGLATTEEQTLAFKVRPAFSAEVRCTRSNPAAGCSPLLPIGVRFSAPVPRATAEAIRLVSGATLRTPQPLETGVPVVEAVTFAGPFAEGSEVRVQLPAAVRDDAGRPLTNQARFPLPLRIDAAPPLVKFSGDFGILEAAEGGVLPVTVRATDAAAGGAAVLKARSLRVGPDAAAISRWLRAVMTAGEERGSDEPVPGSEDTRWRNDTGSTSVFAAGDAARSFDVPKPNGAQAFEVVGIPLKAAGLHVVELASPRLGASLLGPGRTRYVATAALVTDLAVHLQMGREGSSVWVTRLSDGKPVANARVSVAGVCDGRTRWQGVTDAQGLAAIDLALGLYDDSQRCNSYGLGSYLALAVLGEDFSFAASGWTNGIAPYDFGLSPGSLYASQVAHTVLDRALFRAGETVSMKHFLRQRRGSGVGVPAGVAARRKVVISHEGSDQRFEAEVAFDAGGIAEQRWQIPADARLGTYRISIQEDRGERSSGSFQVQQFRLPSMRATVQGAASPLVRPASVPLDLHVAWLSGGGAAGMPVSLRTLVEPRPLQFAGYGDYEFGGAPVREGLVSLGALDEQDGAPEAQGATPGAAATQVLPLTLDANGSARVEIRNLPSVDVPSLLTAELEYADGNGQIMSTTGRVRLAPSGVVLGIRREGWAASSEQLRFQVVALDLEGRPLANQAVSVALYHSRHYSYRKRLLGGFYAYESLRDTQRLAVACTGNTNAQGLLACEVAPGVSGEVTLRAEARDANQQLAGANASVWVQGAEDWWFGGTAGDRMDVLPEQKEYQSGQNARLQVRMPFRNATALVTVEREGVLDSYVRTLDGNAPVIEVPIKDNYAPNVYISVLAVRGRVATAENAAAVRRAGGEVTALVDLNKPAFRLGVANVHVGWSPHRLEVRVTPERSTYRVRETVNVKLQVRRANGAPVAPGAEVALAAVDEALLELAGNPSWDLLAAMMGERGLEVQTATAQMQVVGKRHYGRKAVPSGGGGGRDTARELFDSLLTWRGRVLLDGNGEATVAVPLNDALSSFRIVAVANAGTQLFGTGSATVNTTQDLILTSGLPPLVREGDRLRATVSVRNATNRAMRVQLGTTAGAAGAPVLVAQTVELPAGAARDVAWTYTVPVNRPQLGWDVSATEVGGAARDRLRFTVTVAAAYPVRTWQATLSQLAATPLTQPVELPLGAVAGRGAIDVALRARLADNLGGVREYLTLYPYTCIEQQLSSAVAMRDRARWNAVAATLPSYLDRDGLLKYFQSDRLQGDDSLSAYVLAIAAEAGYELPPAVHERLVAGLAAFVAGRVQRDSALATADRNIRKLAAISALARHDAASAEMLDSIAIEPDLWPTSALLDYLDVLRRVPNLPNAAPQRTRIEGLLRARLNFQGTTLGFATERNDALWWLMISTDANAARLVLAVLDRPAWREDMPRLVRGLLGRQQRGHWNTTLANAWGVLAMEKFSAAFESTPVEGVTTVSYGATTRTLDWAQPAAAVRSVNLPWQSARAPLSVAHSGSGAPWVLIRTSAALPLTAPLSTGFRIKRTVTPVTQAVPGRWSRGDVMRVRLDLEAQSDMSWVVVDDPVPAGAAILGTGLGGQSELLTRGEQNTGVVWPAFEERRYEGFRSYFRFVPKGSWSVEYTLRLNNAGTFALPATHVEAMYAPEMLGELPNAALTVEPRG